MSRGQARLYEAGWTQGAWQVGLRGSHHTPGDLEHGEATAAIASSDSAGRGRSCHPSSTRRSLAGPRPSVSFLTQESLKKTAASLCHRTYPKESVDGRMSFTAVGQQSGWTTQRMRSSLPVPARDPGNIRHPGGDEHLILDDGAVEMARGPINTNAQVMSWFQEEYGKRVRPPLQIVTGKPVHRASRWVGRRRPHLVAWW